MLLLSAYFVSAQDEKTFDYDRWSIEVAGGLHKNGKPMAAGYSTPTPGFGQVSLGTRYMLNNRFGAKLDFGYSTFQEEKDYPEFKSNYYRVSLQGVANLGSVLNFETWTNTIGLLAHAGAGYSQLSAKEPIDRANNDQMLHVIAGLTPQLRLGNNVAITADLSAISNMRQDITWDGTSSMTEGGFDGLVINFSAGLTFYLGSNEKHADWYTKESVFEDKLSDHEDRISKIETDLLDTDQDGVPDYLDREPNTVSGVTVNSKGIAVDKNENGIPDELEGPLDERYVKKDGYVPSDGSSIAELLNKGYVNVYFRFNSDTPETYSLEAINYLMKYMKDHPSANAELIGYADEIGNPEYNKTLSEKRAKRVYDILIASGVAANRLSYSGNGEDNSVDKGSAPARQLVRRVTFRLK